MWSVGIDAHHRLYVACILDESGRVVKEFKVKGSPQELVGALGELGRPFRAAIEASTGYGDTCTVRAIAPLAELQNYSNELKSMTAGAGSYAMDYSHDEITPPNIQAEVVAAYTPHEDD